MSINRRMNKDIVYMRKKKVKVTQLCLTFYYPNGLYRPWNSPGQNTEVGSLSLLQEIFPTQGLNPGLPHCRQILYQLGPRKPSGIYTMDYYSVIKKNKIMPFAATWMDPETVILSEVSQRRRNFVWRSLYVESKKKKKDTNELMYKIERNSENELMVATVRRTEEGIVREFGMDMYALLYLIWTTNEALLYSTWNFVQ